MSAALDETPFDTIYAVCSARGPGARAVLRVSGPEAFAALRALGARDLERARGPCSARLVLPGRFHVIEVPVLLLRFPGPASYTGEDVVEIHALGAPALVELLDEGLADAGLRPARPGEFTRRAFSNGKLDLEQAEALCQLIRAGDDRALEAAAARIGEHERRSNLRAELLDLLATIEAGFDFEEVETGFVDPRTWAPELERLAAELAARAERRTPAWALPSFVLLGPANAGKTSLWNRLADPPVEGLVSEVAGTTRDLRWAICGGGRYRLADAPGRGALGFEAEELRLLRQELASSDGYLWVSPADDPCPPPIERFGRPRLVITSKVDLRPGTEGCSARTGEGLAELGIRLQRLEVGDDAVARLAGEFGLRYRSAAEHVVAARNALDRGPECVAAELREAIAYLEPGDRGAIPEQVLDRIFQAFCVGK